MANRGSAEKTKRILMAGLGVILLLVFVYEVFLSGPTPRPRLNAQATNGGSSLPAPAASAPVVPQNRPLSAAAQQEAEFQALLSDLTPLNVRLISSADGHTAQVGSRGNIFAYFVEPPKPPPPPPPPPPIQLISVQPQTAVAGVPRPITVVITGNKIPADAQIILSGTPRVTKRVSDTQLSTELAPGDYALAGNINIEVKSQSNPADNSNALAFIVQSAPEPQFTYKGRLGTLNQPQYNYGVFELTATKEVTRAKVGDTVMGVWRIDAVSSDSVDVTNTQLDIKRRLPLQDKVR
jgi:hypothetical protein